MSGCSSPDRPGPGELPSSLPPRSTPSAMFWPIERPGTVLWSVGEIADYVKGRRAGHRSAWTQERERIINPLVQHVSAALKRSAASDQWNLLGFERIPGDHPKVVNALLHLPDITCPAGIEVKRAEDRWAAYTKTPELLAGTSLLHTEWAPGNVLVADRACLVDWAWPTRGAAWMDPACLAVWLTAYGHAPPSAESWAARIPSWQSAPPAALDEFARIQALMREGISADSPEEWTTNLARASRQYASYRESH